MEGQALTSLCRLARETLHHYCSGAQNAPWQSAVAGLALKGRQGESDGLYGIALDAYR